MCSSAYAYLNGLTPKPAIPFAGSKSSHCPTRIGAGPSILCAKAAASSSSSSSRGGGGFAVSPAASKVSFYEVLGLAATATAAEVKKAYKKLARKYHPDVSPPGRVKEYTKKFIMLQEAYDTLSDPTKRALHDCDLAIGFQSPFLARTRTLYHHHQVMEQRNEWRIRWESQLSELMRISKYKEYGCGENLSWAAQLRNQKIRKMDF